jgi:hypothetical protein
MATQGMTGADLPALQSLSDKLTFYSGAINDMNTTLSTQLANTPWTGPISEAFRSDWESEFKTFVKRMADSFSQASTDVTNQKNALEAAVGIR